ncbi:MAG: penicillin-binding transpeptidase domain-containing protein [Pseudomonadota bacterium]|nr:penicillin-binding transpeptidase domain-containing protein [Pseudomonadota bacterium]
MTPSNPIDLFNALVDSAAWPTLRIGLHIVFLLVVGYILKLMFDFRDLTALRHLSRPKRKSLIPVVGLTLLFASVLLYQATWQLTGVTRPDFVAFMQSHDRRQFNPAHRIRRGRIVDRHGEVLAYSQEYRGQVYRRYPYGPAFAHVVGYSDPKFGASGMEAAANAHLNGSTPASLTAWGELGRQLLTQEKRPRGQDLVLTLDAELQLMAVKMLGRNRGAVVLLRPDNGAIRALASTPSYDPNRISSSLFRGGDPEAPLLNRATQGLYPPGSTFKIVLAAQALNAGFKGRLHCPADGYTTSSRYRKIRDHEYYRAKRNGQTWKGHGDLDLGTALAESSNVFFAKLGVGYGHDAFYESTERFLFNRQIRLHESPYGAQTMSMGRIPRIAKSNQYGLAQMSIGQGRLLVTPAQMALITASVANRGLAVKPRLVESEPSFALSRFMSTNAAHRLARMMRKVVAEGTGRGIDVDAFSIAGKTGTAQNPQGKAHSWFIGFAPAERPALAVAVLVEHGGYGSKTAAPIARDLLVRAGELGMLH